jgi:hypothetical protein
MSTQTGTWEREILCGFENDSLRIIYVNPTQVRAIWAQDSNRTRIVFNQDHTVVVDVPLERVREAPDAELTGEPES